MIDDEVIGRTTEEVLAELGMENRRFEIEAAMAAPDENARQIRLFDEAGTIAR